jgi:hypothetical protein
MAVGKLILDRLMKAFNLASCSRLMNPASYVYYRFLAAPIVELAHPAGAAML